MLFVDDIPCKRFRPRDDVDGLERRRCGCCFRLNNEEEFDGSKPNEINKKKILKLVFFFEYYRLINDEIVMTLNNLMWIDLYNHQSMNLTLLYHLVDRIEVPYPIKTDRSYL
jgi:hypothetical protein